MVSPRRRLVRGLATAWLVAGAGAAGCALVAGLDGDRTLAAAGTGGAGAAGGAHGTTGAGGSAGAGGATHSDAGAPDGAAGAGGKACKPASYPPPPAVQDAGGAIDFVTAMHSVDLGDTGTVVGLDLDGKCTCEGDGPSCRHPDWIKEDLCDGPDGRDAQSALLFKEFSFATSGSIGTAGFSSGCASGTWSMLIRVRGYNGKADDDQVQVSLFPSAGLDKAARPAKWDGTDAWPVPPTALADGGKTVDEPRYVDAKAYVTSGHLVTSMPESEMYLAGSNAYLPIRFIAGFLVARIVPVGQTFGLRDGILAARWKTADIFDSVHAVRIKGSPLCTDSPLYAPVKHQICNFIDIYSGIATPTTTCDSISVGLAFTADPAKLGPIQALPTPPQGCPAATDPAGDDCP
jgi:hypothetical protein